MLWLKRIGMLVVVAVIGAAGCGSDSYDEPGFGGGTLQFLGFTGEGINQSDQVRVNSADVDLCATACNCPGFCSLDTTFDVQALQQTVISAGFRNIGKSDIVLDSYWVEIDEAAGVAPKQYPLSAKLPGGVCADIERPCAIDDECSTGDQSGECVHSNAVVPGLLLYDFDTKEHLVRGFCPAPVADVDNGAWVMVGDPGSPQTYSVKITFSGKDEADHRFTIQTAYVSTFADFACD